MSSSTIKNGGNAQPTSFKKPVPNMPNKTSSGGAKPNRKEDDKSVSNRKVFVGGLTPNTTKDNMIEYFSKFGGVEDANIKMDLATGRSRGYGFVLFETKEIADQVLSSSDHVIMGKSVDVKTAKYKGAAPVKKVFLGGLDPNFPETELREYFSQYGKIEDIELPFDKQKNQRRSYCFILFESEETVNEILKKPKHILGGKEVDVKKATPPKDQNQQNALMQPQWNQLPNWNAQSNGYFPDPQGGGYGAPNYGGLYNAPGSYGGQPGNYPANYNENFEGGYVDYDDPTSSYDYGSGSNFPAAAAAATTAPYDQSAFYQNNPMNGSYDYYDQNLYGNYNAPEQFNQAQPPVSSSKSHHSYGKVSKRSSQSQSYHPYNRQ